MASLNLVPAAVEDYRPLAERRLPRQLFDYIDGGSYDEVSLARNRTAFRQFLLRQQVMRDVSRRDPSVDVLGEELAMPAVLAPIGFAGMMARRGEVQAAQAAERAGVPFCLSTLGVCSVEEVAAATTKPFWFQLYMLRDRGYVEALLERAREAGCRTLVFTVDLAVVGARYRDMRNGLGGVPIPPLGRLRRALDFASHPRWLYDVPGRGRPLTFGNLAEYVSPGTNLSGIQQWIDSQFDPGVTWRDIEWLRGRWDGKLLIKGVLEPDDARAAVDAGADGVIVSNHGGRQLDGVPAGIEQLPRVRDEIGDRASLLVDGGVRSGQDLAKARALGAQAALVGRPWIWALGAGGGRAVEAVLATLRRELDVTLALTGTPNARDVGWGNLHGPEAGK